MGVGDRKKSDLLVVFRELVIGATSCAKRRPITARVVKRSRLVEFVKRTGPLQMLFASQAEKRSGVTRVKADLH